MIFGIGHYNDEKQAEFVQYMIDAFKRQFEPLLSVSPRTLPHELQWFPDDIIVPGIQTHAEAEAVQSRRGLLLKIVHPGVAPTTSADKLLLDHDWDYVLGVNGDSESLIADAQEFADWVCGHACRPDQSAIARQAALQIEQDAIHGADTS
jgi:hypothetical protein